MHWQCFVTVSELGSLRPTYVGDMFVLHNSNMQRTHPLIQERENLKRDVGMAYVPKSTQTREDMEVKVNMQSPVPTSFYNRVKM